MLLKSFELSATVKALADRRCVDAETDMMTCFLKYTWLGLKDRRRSVDLSHALSVEAC